MDYPKCYVLVRGRNASRYLLRCLESLRMQSYSNLQVLFVDDGSDYSREYRKSIFSLLKEEDVPIWRKERYFSVRNAYEVIHKYCTKNDGIVFNLDADDWLSSSESISDLVKSYIKNDWYFTYGDCYIWSGDDTLQPQASSVSEYNKLYPKEIVQKNAFRDYQFLPLHPRTWKVHAFKNIPKEAFLSKNGSWLRYCEDQVIFFPLLEMYYSKCGLISEPISVYNVENPNSDSKTELIASLRDELEIRNKLRYESQDS